jgi:biopolymer transport protein ExbD
MNFFNRMVDDEPVMPIAPMIDIVFLLLIFFVTTSIFARLENEISVTVPTAETSTPPKRSLGELIVNLRSDGTLVVNQTSVTIDQLQLLLNRIAKQYPDNSVIIRGDRKAFLGDAVAILDVCAKAGVWNVDFAALPPETETESNQ